MGKHVEGEWVLAWEDGKHGVIATVPGKLIAIVANVTPDDGLNDTRKANAQLMAASPDLLAACEMFIKSWRSGQREKLDVASRMTEAAIAKAKGE